MQKELIVGELKDVEGNTFRFRQHLNGQFASDFVVTLPDWFILGKEDDEAVKQIILASMIQMGAVFPKAIFATNFQVKESVRRLWEQYCFAQHKQNAYNLGTDIVEPEFEWRCMGDERLRGESEEESIEDLEAFTVVTAMSGGKDSLLHYFMLEELGEVPFNYTIRFATIACARGMNRYIKQFFHKVGINTHTAWNNTNQRQALPYANILQRRYGINPDLNLRDDSFTSQVSMLYEDLSCIEQCLLSGLLAQRLPNAKWLIAGDEFTDNKTYKGQVFNPDTGQSWLSKILLSRIYSELGLPQRFGSVIYNLEFPAEYLIIDRRYRERSWILSSCISNFDEEGNRWCSHCGKDAWAYLIWKALGIDPEYYGLKEKLLFKRHHLFRRKPFTGDVNFGGYSEDEYIFRVLDEKYGSWIKWELTKNGTKHLPKPLKFLLDNLPYEATDRWKESIIKASKNLAYTIPEEFRKGILEIEDETVGLTDYTHCLEPEEIDW